MLWIDKAKKILLKYWNIDQLKNKQYEVINNILLNHDVIGLLPTGYGKSICYLLPPLLTKKTMIIISPLIALMEDQKEKLINMGILVSALHSNNSNKDNEIIEILEGKIKIVYMSPEYIMKGEGLNIIHKLNDDKLLGYIAIDESHCLSSWGHDFRPQYLQLKLLKKNFPKIPIMAVTATANNYVVNDIINNLELVNPYIVRANFDRPNLYLECLSIPKLLRKKMSYDEIIRNYINKYRNEKIIVYVNSRKKTEEISEALNSFYNSNISNFYHAGLNKNNRNTIQTNFSNGTFKIIISTIAFGMGIDQIVKCVLVIGSPSSIEEYYQQIGRGGRDGKYCHTVLYLDLQNYNFEKKRILDETTDVKLKRKKMENIEKLKEYFETNKCRRLFILEYLGLSNTYFDENGFYCNNCDNCKNNELIDITNNIWNYYFLKQNINKLINYSILLLLLLLLFISVNYRYKIN